MKVDLRELEQDVRYMHDDEIIALIRVARAAKALLAEVVEGYFKHDAEDELAAALSDIEDSAHG